MARYVTVALNGNMKSFPLNSNMVKWEDVGMENDEFKAMLNNQNIELKAQWVNNTIGAKDSIPSEETVRTSCNAAGKRYQEGHVVLIAQPTKVKQGRRK